MNSSMTTGNKTGEKHVEKEKQFSAEEKQQFEINWESLWEKSKIEFWGLIAFFLLSFVATVIRIYRKRQNGGRGRHRWNGEDAGHAGPGVSLANFGGGAGTTDEGATESVRRLSSGEEGGGGGGDGDAGRDRHPPGCFKPTPGRTSWRW